MELSRKTENLLSRISLRAVDCTPSSGSTRPGALTAGEFAGVLALLDHEREKRIMLVLADQADQGVYYGLVCELLESAKLFPWGRLVNPADQTQATKLGIAAFLAIQEIAGKNKMNASQKANALGISGGCFYKTWRGRIDDFSQLLRQWAYDADSGVCRILKYEL